MLLPSDAAFILYVPLWDSQHVYLSERTVEGRISDLFPFQINCPDISWLMSDTNRAVCVFVCVHVRACGVCLCVCVSPAETLFYKGVILEYYRSYFAFAAPSPPAYNHLHLSC